LTIVISIYVRQGLFFSEAKEYSVNYFAYLVAKAGGAIRQAHGRELVERDFQQTIHKGGAAVYPDIRRPPDDVLIPVPCKSFLSL